MNYCMWLYSRNYAAGIHRNCHESSDGFAEYKKNPCLNQATPKNTCQNFPTQKDPEIKNLNPKKSFDLSCHLKSGVLPLSQGFPLQP